MSKHGGLAAYQTALAVRARDGDRAALAELVKSMRPYVRRLMKRHPNIDREDFQQCAALGILSALPNFDPERGEFAAAASSRILFELNEYADAMLHAVRLPKSRVMRKLKWHIRPAVARLCAGGMSEEDAMIQACEEAGVSLDEARDFFASQHAVEVASEQPDVEGAPAVFVPSVETDPLEGIEDDDRRYAMQILRDGLSEEHWRILWMRLAEDASQRHIAEAFGISRERVRQKLVQILPLAMRLLDEAGLDAEALL